MQRPVAAQSCHCSNRERVLLLSVSERALMFTSDLLKNKRFLVTGGGTGIGRALAERFLQLGATGYICGRRADVIQQTAKELAASAGAVIEAFACDVRDYDAVEK